MSAFCLSLVSDLKSERIEHTFFQVVIVFFVLYFEVP